MSSASSQPPDPQSLQNLFSGCADFMCRCLPSPVSAAVSGTVSAAVSAAVAGTVSAALKIDAAASSHSDAGTCACDDSGSDAGTSGILS